MGERPMIYRMSTTSRPQQRYDHRLRDLVQRTGDLTIATELGIPRSTARGWLRAAPTVVVSLEVCEAGDYVNLKRCEPQSDAAGATRLA